MNTPTERASIWPLFRRALRRDLRAGSLRIIALALTVAVGAISAVGLFTDRVGLAMNQQAAALLGGDLLVRSAEPLPAAMTRQAAAIGLETTVSLRFPSVVLHGEQTLLVDVHAVGSRYPLRGDIRTQKAPDGTVEVRKHPPPAGTLWLDRNGLARLHLNVGDEVQLGRKRFRIGAVLRDDPGRGGGLLQFAPQALIASADLAGSGLITAQSRVGHTLYMAGPPAAVARMRGWLDSHLPPGARVQGLRDGTPEVRAALERAQRFLGLAALAAVLLGGGAIAVATREFARREADHAAIMRCLGATPRLLLQLTLLRLLSVGVAGSLLGLGLGYLAQRGLVALLAGWFGTALPPPGFGAALVGIGSGLLTLAGFGLIPVLRIKDVPPLRILRRELAPPPPSAWLTAVAAILALGALAWWQTGDARLTGWVLGGAGASVLALWLCGYLLVTLLTRWHPRRGGFGMRFGLRSLARRREMGAVQLAAVGLGLTSLLLLAFVRADLLSSWQASLPADAPNQFAINIQTGERGALNNYFKAHDQAPPKLYPMVRGRLSSINGKPVSAQDYADPRARNLVRREFNLTWAESLQKGNKVIAGRWWNRGGKGFSVEEGIAKTLGLKLGDTLGFDVAGQHVSARIDSLRTVQWDSFRPNFFVVAHPGLLDGLPASWMTSFHLPAQRDAFLAGLVRSLPGITLFDVDTLLGQVRTIIERAVWAVQYVFAFSLLAGIVVLFAAIDSTRGQRRREAALLRTLGASNAQLRTTVTSEFLLLGLISGLLAATFASGVGYVLATRVFDLVYRFDPWLWLAGLTAGGLGVLIVGLLGTRTVLRTPPQDVLRSAL
ncbi:MAG: FtsX-like permease family protein [Acidihalobacter sp.]|uniref:ABC transporter permease n=1 Tax=Acidihalobacter sp. TaxID=1872108 RepID=UPI00307F99A9